MAPTSNVEAVSSSNRGEQPHVPSVSQDHVEDLVEARDTQPVVMTLDDAEAVSEVLRAYGWRRGGLGDAGDLFLAGSKHEHGLNILAKLGAVRVEGRGGCGRIRQARVYRQLPAWAGVAAKFGLGARS